MTSCPRALAPILMATALAGCPLARAQAPATDHAGHPAPAATAAASAPALAMSEGEVRQIDRAQATLTLRHGPITNLDMAAMTMVFKVASPSLLDAVKVGDKLRFRAERVRGVITVTAMEVVR